MYPLYFISPYIHQQFYLPHVPGTLYSHDVGNVVPPTNVYSYSQLLSYSMVNTALSMQYFSAPFYYYAPIMPNYMSINDSSMLSATRTHNEDRSEKLNSEHQDLDSSKLPTNFKHLKISLPPELQQDKEFHKALAHDLNEGSITPKVLTKRVYDHVDLEAVKISVNHHQQELERCQGSMNASKFGFGEVASFMNSQLSRQQGVPSTNKALELKSSQAGAMIKKLDAYKTDESKFHVSKKWFFVEQSERGINRYGIDSHFCKDLLPSNIDAAETSHSHNSSSTQTNTEMPTTQKILCPAELFVIRKALSSLAEVDKGVVLVDIFGRDTHGNIKLDLKREDNAEVHTVVLYKESTKVTVLDPINGGASRHVVLDINEILCQADVYLSLSSLNKLQKFYQRPKEKKTGMANDNFRDCVDIAYKLATIIQNLGFPATPTETKGFTNWNPLLQITNNPTYHYHLSNEFKTYAIRARQSSDDAVRDNFNTQVERLYDLEQKGTVDVVSGRYGVLTSNIDALQMIDKLNLIGEASDSV